MVFLKRSVLILKMPAILRKSVFIYSPVHGFIERSHWFGRVASLTVVLLSISVRSMKWTITPSQNWCIATLHRAQLALPQASQASLHPALTEAPQQSGSEHG